MHSQKESWGFSVASTGPAPFVVSVGPLSALRRGNACGVHGLAAHRFNPLRPNKQFQATASLREAAPELRRWTSVDMTVDFSFQRVSASAAVRSPSVAAFQARSLGGQSSRGAPL